jgi:hypothetical protein
MASFSRPGSAGGASGLPAASCGLAQTVYPSAVRDNYPPDRLFRVQTTNGSFDWAAPSMLSIIITMHDLGQGDALLGILELPQ